MEHSKPKTLNILGVTGSIGTAARDVVLATPQRFQVQFVSAHQNVEALAQAARALNARTAIIGDEARLSDLRAALNGTHILAYAGAQALCDHAAQPADITLAAIMGLAGLRPLLAALAHSRCVAIANKEPLVAAGALVKEIAARHGTTILPVDSEHNAIFQVFDPSQMQAIERIILTASGGPFRTWSAQQIKAATPAQALAHPNWSMGAKISIDSATLMNKGLEVIEAHHLFDLPAQKIDVLVHPQSLVHGMVEYVDGSVLAQMAAPDMRTPLTHVLSWPQRMRTPGARMDWAKLKSMDFEAPDLSRFPCLDLAYEALQAGQGACIALNAANEMAVAAFLEGHIGFVDISDVVRAALELPHQKTFGSVDAIIAHDLLVRASAHAYISRIDNRKKRA
ncbi:MAG: 1-deoxy-D-xylulose-5-phosphate reductoisomerase [Alphaproteobacteria bacterium]|nr:1-deoxy-D-xylulose-5-phosphate reductoisomerase [Alphaproteobacteria bacterium]